jgi:hypothetical protein
MQGRVANRAAIRVDEAKHQHVHRDGRDWYEFPFVNMDCDFVGWQSFGEEYWEASDGWMASLQGMLAGGVVELHRNHEVYWLLVRKVRYEMDAGAKTMLLRGARLQHAKWGIPGEDPDVLNITRVIAEV